MPTTANDYEDRAIFEYRGVTYRYDKPRREWCLVDTDVACLPRTIYAIHDQWRSLCSSAATPQGVLEAYAKSLMELRGEEAREAILKAQALCDEVSYWRSNDWKTAFRKPG
jgi:hypothetical protein